ncbi:cilia- and flagella-associated protein 58-like [Eriocheir sinensis]|uniref:cilia- and flagella-associated protein 58-like n=1 Tax=Eriocheir sinensis TaxID=95602 RepID=UPI0021C84BE0|nr:cilia- and flagella-associated protein 58-like [Eriocheir sinensis]
MRGGARLYGNGDALTHLAGPKTYHATNPHRFLHWALNTIYLQEASSEGKEEAPAVSTTNANASEGDETVTVEELEEKLKQSRAETAAAKEQVTGLTQQLATSIPRAEALLARRDLEKRIETLTRDNQTLTEAVEKEQREREWLEGELRAQYEAAEGTDQEMTNLQTFVRKLHALVEEKTKSLETQKEERDSMARLLEEAKEEAARLKKDVEGRTRVLSRVETAYKETTTVVKLKEEDLVKLQKESSTARRQYDQLEKTVRRHVQRRADVEVQVKNLRGQTKVLEKQVVTETRQRQRSTRQAEKLKRERDVLHRAYVKAQGTIQKHSGLVHIREVERQNAERDLARTSRDLSKQDRLINTLQRAKDRQVEETSRLETKVVELVEEAEAQGREVERLLHTQAATQTNLQQVNSLSDALKTDNFILSRQLRNVRTEKEELLEEARKAGYLVTKLQQNLNTRDTDIQKLGAEVSMLERLAEQLKAGENAARSVADERQRAVQYAVAEKVALTRLLHQQDASNKDLLKEIEEGQEGRAVVTTQLARRNDEVRALRERVKLLEHVLHKGDKDYNNRLQDITTLTNEVNSLRDERQVLGRHVKLVEALKVELVRLQRELIASQNKRAVLEEEIIRREKSHRWTTLKASDPSKYDLLKKNHLLQKRLVAATQRVAASEGEIGHKEREVEEMRRAVERSAVHHSDAAAKPHLISQLRAKDDQIKSVTAALNVALLAQEEAEQERRHLRTQLAATMRKMNNLQRRLQAKQPGTDAGAAAATGTTAAGAATSTSAAPPSTATAGGATTTAAGTTTRRGQETDTA